MNGRKPRGLTRRKFLFTAGGAASALTFGCSRGPGPAPTVRVSTGNGVTPANALPSVDLPALTLTAADSGPLGWSFGHVFKQGDVPGGSHPAAISGASAFQADVRNFWADGSVKYAVLSGISNFTANSPIAVQMGTTRIAPSGANVPEPTAAQVENVAVELTTTATSFSISRAVTLRLSDVLGRDLSTWSANNAGRVRQILGQVMSEFHYYQPVNSLLHVCWYVRAYSNGAIEIERVIENGWWPTTGQTQQDYSIATYTNSSSTSDFSMPYMGYQFPAQHNLNTSYYVSPATNELVVVGGGAGDDYNTTPAEAGAGGVPVVNSNFYLNGNSSTVYAATASNITAHVYSSTVTYVPGNFVSQSTALWQATSYYPSGTNQPLPAIGQSNSYWTYITEGTFLWMRSSGGALPSSVTSIFLIGHCAFTRWSRVDWIGGAPVTPQHDNEYLRSTKMVPNYGYTTQINGVIESVTALKPTENSYNGNASTTPAQPWPSALNPVPFQLGCWTVDLGNVGYQSDIGLLPQWEAVYCSSSNTDIQRLAYAATISNHRGAGRWQLFRRDSSTGRPVNYLSYPNNSFVIEWSTNSDPNFPPDGNNLSVWQGEAIAHSPSNGYLVYLIEGRWSACEATAFTATHVVMFMRPDDRQSGGTLCLYHPSENQYASFQERAFGWAIRTMAQATAAQPRFLGGTAASGADSTLTSAYVQSMVNTAGWNYATYVTGTNYSGVYRNTIGLIGWSQGGSGTALSVATRDPITGAALTNAVYLSAWEEVYQRMALCHACEICADQNGLASSDFTTLENLRDFALLGPLLLDGTGSTFNYRSGVGIYWVPRLDLSSTAIAPVFLTIPEQYQAYLTAEGYTDPTSGASLFLDLRRIRLVPMLTQSNLPKDIRVPEYQLSQWLWMRELAVRKQHSTP